MVFHTTETDTSIVKIAPPHPPLTIKKWKLYSLRLSMLKAALNKRKTVFHQQIGLKIQEHETSEIAVSNWNVMAQGDAREGKWRGNWRMEWVACTLHTTLERDVYSITTADAHTSAASSRLNWCPRRFKWIRPFRRKTKSGFCACAITFQTQSTLQHSFYGAEAWTFRKINHEYLECFEMWFWRRMEKISWTDRVREMKYYTESNRRGIFYIQ